MFLGIDPGLNGGLAWVDSGDLIYSCVMPTADKFIDLRSLYLKLHRYDVHHAFLEKVASMPGQGVASTFKFGRVYGATEALLSALCIPYTLIPPQRWTKAMHRGIEPLADTPKERSRLAASMLWPEHDFRKSSRAKLPHDGKVDAALIAEYGRSYEIPKIP